MNTSHTDKADAARLRVLDLMMGLAAEENTGEDQWHPIRSYGGCVYSDELAEALGLPHTAIEGAVKVYCRTTGKRAVREGTEPERKHIGYVGVTVCGPDTCVDHVYYGLSYEVTLTILNGLV